MSTAQTLNSARPLTPPADLTEEHLEAAAELARDHVRAVDAGQRGTRRNLEVLGEQGLLALGGREEASRLARALAREDMATAFSFWGHRMGIEYHRAVGAELPEGVEDGRTPISSGMAPAFKAASGLAPIPLLSTAAPGGWRVSGTLPWASNLHEDGWIVVPVAPADEDAAGLRGIVRLRLTPGSGAEIKPLEGLLALDGTASGMVRLADVFIPEADVLSRDIPAFLGAVRRTFLTVQTSFCLGLAEASLELAESLSADGSCGPQNVFAEDLEQVRAQVTGLRASWERLASAEDLGDDAARAPLAARLEAAHTAAAATSLEAHLVGGRGYAWSSPTARRLREAAFLPVQSPTEGHLRWELRRVGAA